MLHDFLGRWMISPQRDRSPQTKGRILSKSNWVDGLASGAWVTLYCLEAPWARVTQQQLYHLEVPLGGCTDSCIT